MSSEQDPREVVEGLLLRPFWRDRPLPVLVLSGQEDVGRRLAEPFKSRLPYARAGTGDYEDLAGLVNAVAGERGLFGASTFRHSFLPAPRFPLTEFVLWAWEQRKHPPPEWPGKWPPNPDSRPAQDEIKARFGKRFGVRSSIQGGSRSRWVAGDFVVRAAVFFVPLATVAAWWLDAGFTDLIQFVPGAVALLIGVVAAAYQAVRFIRGSSFSRWFRTHRLQETRRARGDSRPKYALHLMNAEERDIERLLVYAMLEDLRQAYRKWPRIPWPSWGRGLYALLVLEPGEVNARFLRVMDEVVRDTGIIPPVLVLAQTDAASLAPESVVRPSGFGQAVDTWRARVAPRGPEPHVCVDTDWLGFDGKYESRRKRVRVRAVGYWLVVAALVIAPPLVLYGSNVFGCGPGMESAERQCVGLSDNLDEIDPSPLLRPILERIERQNEAINGDQRVVTVFYLGPLTTWQPGDDQISGSAGELSGLATRQRAFNQLNSWQIRIEYANAGQDFHFADFAAQMIKERAAGDPNVAGVVGLAWSRTETQAAIRLLGDAHIPMVSTSNTADATPLVYGGRPSPYFFRLAAPNSAQARAAEFWLRHGLPGGKPVEPEKTAILVEIDAAGRELYSKDLAEGLTRARDGVAPPYARARRYEFADQNELAKQIQQACEDGVDVLVYTGRGSYLSTLTDTREHRCGANVRILAGDDVTDKVAQRLAEDTVTNRPAMSFVALNDARVSERSVTRATHTQLEIENWIHDVPHSDAVSRVHARLGYDALLAITSAINQIKSVDVDETVNIAESVAYNLRGLGVDEKIQGATGAFYFSEDADSHSALPRDLWLFSAEPTAQAPILRGTCTVDEKAPGTAELAVHCTIH